MEVHVVVELFQGIFNDVRAYEDGREALLDPVLALGEDLDADSFSGELVKRMSIEELADYYDELTERLYEEDEPDFEIRCFTVEVKPGLARQLEMPV